MICYPEKIHTQLNIHSNYLIFGDEYWLIKYCKQEIYKQAAKSGFNCKTHFIYEVDYSWHEFTNLYYSNDIFATKKIIEINTSTSIKPSDQKRFAELEINPNIILIITGKQLNANQKTAAWFVNLKNNGLHIPCSPLKPFQQKTWINKIAQKHKLNITQDALNMIYELCEGNMVGAEQSIYQLRLTNGTDQITEHNIQQNITKKSNYTLQELTTAVLNFETHKVIEIIQQLKYQNYSFSLVLWALKKILEQIHFLAQNHNPEDNEKMFQRNKIWGNKKDLYQASTNKINNINVINELISKTNEAYNDHRNTEKENWVNLLHLYLSFSEANKEQTKLRWI